MRKSRKQILDWEASWTVPAAAAAFGVVVLLIAAQLISQVSGDGDAEVLRSIDENSGSVAAAGALQAIGFALMAVPLFFLFRAAAARSERVRPQLVGLVIAAPLFLAVSAGLTIGARGEAADQFVAGEAKSTLTPKEAKEDCEENRQDEGKEGFAEEYEPAAGEAALAACEKRETEDDEASNAIGEASLAGIVSGLGIAGGLGLLFAFLYTGLWAMRTGLLTRFWGSLGMVAGFAFLLGPLFIVTMIWLLYFAFLCLGLVPGGRPPAWAAGAAIPWPSPGEKAAAELDPRFDLEEPEEPPEPPEPDQLPSGPDENGGGAGPEPGERRRKRKRRE
ncbi:MAG: hypothetical protein R2725_01905 [Solirubrobacterales bacterium]